LNFPEKDATLGNTHLVRQIVQSRPVVTFADDFKLKLRDSLENCWRSMSK
jgi:hypothetical protein